MVHITGIVRAENAFRRVMVKRPSVQQKFHEKPVLDALPAHAVTKNKQKPSIKKKIFDLLVMNVKGGGGGCGNPKLRGKGGKGGDVYFIATKGESLNSLQEKLPYTQISAESGGDATNKNKCLGKDGVDKWIPVPVGVNIYDNLGNYLGGLSKEGHSMLIAKGGQGGTSKNNYINKGGVSTTAKIELQIVADVGLVGLKNAGKTTLLHHLTEPIYNKVPRTEPTLYAEVKRMTYPDHRQVSILDAPHLSSGISSDNSRHAQRLLHYLRRTRLLLICLDGTGSKIAPNKRLNLFESFMLLNKELEMYHPKILKRPSIVVVNKFDSPDSQYSMFEDQINNLPDFINTLPKDLQPTQPFKVQHLFGMDLMVKEGAKLDLLWEVIRRSLDAYEHERREQEIENNRQMRNQQRSA